MERLEVEKAFHPFIAGPYNRLVTEIMQETGTRINIPPPSVNRTEIVFTGEKEQLAQAVARIKKIYEEKVRQAPHAGVGHSRGPARPYPCPWRVGRALLAVVPTVPHSHPPPWPGAATGLDALPGAGHVWSELLAPVRHIEV